jgi:transposase
MLVQWPTMPATVIAERIGWTRSLTVLKERVRELRPLFVPPDPASRTDYQPGELAQSDLWFPPVDVPLGFGQVGRPPVLVMVSVYSRMVTARMLPSRQSPDLLAGHWALINERVPKALVWDNESAVGQWRGGKPQLTEAMNAFRGTLGIKVIQCRPADPEAKGLVERANGYLETSFLPGRGFVSPADFNTQLVDWLVRANQRQHRRRDAARSTGGKLIGPRCSSCRSWPRSSAGGPRPGCRAITTFGWTPTTTRCTRARSVDGSRSSPIWSRSRSLWAAARSLGMTGAGLFTRALPTLFTRLPPRTCAKRAGWSRCRPSTPMSNVATWADYDRMFDLAGANEEIA